MSVTGKPLPSPQTILTAVDTQAREALQKAKIRVEPIVVRETPRKTGRLADALKPRVSRTATGQALTVGVSRGRRHGQVTAAQVMRWVQKGTGVYREGPGSKRLIRAKNPLRRMTLPGGARRWSVRGQRPNPFMGRIRAHATPQVEAEFRDGAVAAARETARVIA